jgi:serine/threonine protein kinase
MELVEGETLLDRLIKGPLPLDQTLRYGIEIADALDKAHRHGVVHRDPKPGNVMLTKAGSKLLDFGLAKRGPAGDGGAGLSALEKREKPLTEAGSLLGTYQYMSPEQLEGKDADAPELECSKAVHGDAPSGRISRTGEHDGRCLFAPKSADSGPVRHATAGGSREAGHRS